MVNRDLLLEFFLTFARFEFALKTTGFFRAYPENPKKPPAAEPDWERFATSLRPSFASARSPELQEACNYLLDAPPNRQVLSQGTLAWETPVRGQEADIEFLLRLVRCVRNNLFHGGKHNIEVHEGTQRTEKLLTSSLAVLAECLALSAEQRVAYDRAVL
jgi:hypothetical protein